jgi:hypothetical protein
MKWLVVVVALALVAAVGYFAWPHVLTFRAAREAEVKLLQAPLYRVLKQDEPEVYASVLAQYQRLLGDPSRKSAFIDFANNQIAEAATKRIAHASQAALLNLMQDMVARMKVLNQHPGDACYRFLFPHVSGPPLVTRYFDAASQQHTLDLMAEVIRTAAENPVPLPSAESVKANLAPIVDAIYAEFGSDAQMLANAEAPEVNRVKVCSITISLYERILKLPPADSSALIRTMTQL